MPAPITRASSTPASVEQLADQLGGGVEALVGDVVGVELELALGQDPRREVRDRDAQVVVVEVDPDRDAGGGVEREQDRRAPALVAVGGGRLGALDHQPVGLQLGDEARHGRAREAGAAGDLGARDQPLVAQRVDHAQAVEAAQRLERSRATGGHGGIRTDPVTFVKSVNEPRRALGVVRSGRDRSTPFQDLEGLAFACWCRPPSVRPEHAPGSFVPHVEPRSGA